MCSDCVATCVAAVTHLVNVHSYTIIDTNIDMKQYLKILVTQDTNSLA